MADNVVILEPGDERAQKISKAMASQTASDILQLLADNKKSLTEITDRLSIPLTTAKYHIENLLEAGLITVAETKYSVKGREIKIYAVTNQLLIVAPRQSNVRSLLLKYATLFGVVAFGSLAISLLSPILGQGIMTDSSLNGPPRMETFSYAATPAKTVSEGILPNSTLTPDVVINGSKGISEIAVKNITSVPSPIANPVPVPPGTGASATAALPDIALAFFLGGMIVIIVLVMYEIYLWKKMKS
ncbi:MAG TPA: helix-turn-helix domain-containing protein [Methanoregula sp.]|nr:helix-turn-helix domain-containing protein [Methanoregula sp.]